MTVNTQHRRVIDRQTDRQTSCHSIVQSMHTKNALHYIMLVIKMRNFSNLLGENV